jgi:hypothetical protein
MLLGVVAYVERRDDLPAVDACLRCLPWSGLLDMPALIRAERRRLRELARVPRR